MFCKNCGQEIDDKAVVCPHCGVAVSSTGPAPVPAQPVYDDSNPLAVAGFVLSFFIAIAGLICSIIGLTKANKEGRKYKGLAIAGIIISIASIVLSIIMQAVFQEIFMQILGEQASVVAALIA